MARVYNLDIYTVMSYSAGFAKAMHHTFSLCHDRDEWHIGSVREHLRMVGKSISDYFIASQQNHQLAAHKYTEYVPVDF